MSVIAMPAGVCGAGGPAANQSLIDIITSLGLTSNLKICLDAGDADSYDSGVQTARWLDTSGNGYDFYRGSSTGGDGAEPTFNGTAGGLSSAEYFSFDGGDYFSYDSANEAWMDLLHNNGSLFTQFCMIYSPSSTILNLFTTARPTNYGAGIQVESNTLRLIVSTPSGLNTTNAVGSAIGINAWQPLGVGVSENGGATGSSYIITGGSTGTWNASNASAATGTPTAAATLGANPLKNNPFANGTRLACFAMWQGTALTTTNLSDIYNAIKGRFGL